MEKQRLARVRSLTLGIVAASLLPMGLRAGAQSPPGERGLGPRDGRRPVGRPGPDSRGRPKSRDEKRGLILKTDAVFPGLTLFAPLNSTKTYLVDLDGKQVHTWNSEYVPGQAVYLLGDGSILRCAREPGNQRFGGGGIGGRVQRIAADGELIWDFAYADENHCQHHDVEPMPNGNVLLIAWEKKTRKQAVEAGRDPDAMRGDEVWPDHVIEVEPRGKTDGRIVWEWHVWDHLVQQFDKQKKSYGVVSEHPELVDINFREHEGRRRESRPELRRLRALGYIGGEDPDDPDEPDRPDGPDDGRPPFGRGPGGFDRSADWCHTNSIDYNAELDQIVLSVHNFSEVWIIDHGTSTQEAAGHRGGRYGKGGDLLYRWGNPRAYGAGDEDDQILFAQHDARWIPKGLPGAGQLTVFNNQAGHTGDGPYSSVLQIATPVAADGRYQCETGRPFGPAKPYWEYTAAGKTEFFASHISGAGRLPNGNTLICDGENGRIFEVDSAGKTVWDYLNPHLEREGMHERPPPFSRGPGERGFRGRDGESRRDRGPRDRGPRGRGRGGPGHGPGGGVFRASRIPMDHPGVMAILKLAQGDQSEKGLAE